MKLAETKADLVVQELISMLNFFYHKTMTMKMIKKSCLTCGNEFPVIPKRKDSAKFCSMKCKHKFGRKTKECLFCGKKFITLKSLDRKYCSHECATENSKRRLVKICTICGKKYEVQHYARNSKYCGIKCRNKGISKTLFGRYKGKENPNHKGRIIKICKYCGKRFDVHPYRKNTAYYCSIKCSKLDMSKETRKKISNSIKKLQKENPKIHPNYVLAQKGHMTKIEKLIKNKLVKRKIPFKVQYKVLSYWLDFAFPEIRLGVECDGKRWHSTKEQLAKDWKRDKKLAKNGWTIIRFDEEQIMEDVEGCMQNIEYLIKRLSELKKEE